ncbi:MAG: glycosyltransferase family 1 protein [Thiobacillus sp.]
MITIDGIIFSLQEQGGISVYFHKLLDHLKLQRVPATLTLESPTRQEVNGGGAGMSVIRRRGRQFERYRPCRIPPDATLFHSGYYRLPDRTNISSVVTVHDFVYERFSHGPRRWIHSWQKNAAIRAAQSIICVSESTRQDLLEYVGVKHGQSVQVIHNGVSDIFRPLESPPSPIPFVLYVGLRGGYKNFDLALKAMALLPDFELHCVGGGPLQSKELAGVPESVTRRVKHVGFVDDKTLNVLYNQAVCLVYPSSYEGFGIPVVEAMRAGCPVVSVECQAVMEVGGAALTIAEGLDPGALADAILKTASSDRANLIERGLSVAQAYSWEKTHARTLAVYRSLAG